MAIPGWWNSEECEYEGHDPSCTSAGPDVKQVRVETCNRLHATGRWVVLEADHAGSCRSRC